MIGDDIALARDAPPRWRTRDPELEAWTTSLSITTFRYVPRGPRSPASRRRRTYLNELNEELREPSRAAAARRSSRTRSSVARYLLRACIVNFRTSSRDIEAVPEIVKRVGRELAASGR